MYADAGMPKDETFKMRLDASDRKRLELVAKHYSLSVASAIRMLVKREADQIAATKAKARAKR